MPQKVFPLPPLPKFRVRSTTKYAAQPCVGAMSSVLTCWASQGHGVVACEKLEQALRVCMDTMKRKPPQKSALNYHMMRLYPKLLGPYKRPKLK